MGESIAGVYFFRTPREVEDALSNWLGDALEDEPSLTILGVMKEDVGEWDANSLELISRETIPPHLVQSLLVVDDSFNESLEVSLGSFVFPENGVGGLPRL